ncbi:MAG: heme-binding protein [Steroidobacteraceae bacterium]
MKYRISALGGMLALMTAVPGNAQIGWAPVFGPDAARKAAEVCLHMAADKGWSLAVVALDEGGHILYAFRMEGGNYARLDFATEKARTALLTRRPSGDLLDRMQSGKEPFLFSIPDYVGMRGGLPVVSEGRVIGAIGASGAKPEEDEACVKAGIDALTGPVKRP